MKRIVITVLTFAVAVLPLIVAFSLSTAQQSSIWDLTIVDSTGTVGQYSSITLDSSNRPHIGYYDYSNYDLKYARWTGSAWTIQTVDSTGDVGKYSSLALDSGNTRSIFASSETFDRS